MSMADRPPPDPAKLLSVWRDWESGDTPPGRTLSSLKTAGFPEFLAATVTAIQEAGGDAGSVAAILDAWDEWERGVTPPPPVVEALAEHGVADLLQRSAAAHQEAFGAE